MHLLKRIHLWIISLIVTIAIFSFLLTRVSFAEVLNLIQGLSRSWIVLFLLFSLAMSVFRTWRYQLLLGVSGHAVPQLPLFFITLVRNLFSDLLPARLGTLVYIYLVRTRLGVPMAPVLSSFAHAFLFDIIALALLILPAIILAGLGNNSGLVLIGAGIALALLSIAFLLILPKFCDLCSAVLGRSAILPLEWQSTLNRLINETGRQLRHTRASGCYWRILALSFGVRCCKYTASFMLFLGLVLPLGFAVGDFPPAKVFLGLCSAELAASLPISGIAGFGAYEGAWALVFQLLGYSEHLAITSSISHHLITQVYGYSLGGVAMLLLLLPGMRNQEMQTMRPLLPSTLLFWGRFTIFSILVVYSGFLLFPVDFGGTAQVPPQKQSAGLLQQLPEGLTGKIVYEHDGGIFLGDIREAQHHRLAPSGRYPRWSPDGTLVAFIDGKQLVVMDSDGGHKKVVATADTLHTFAFGPGGRWLLFADGRKLHKLTLPDGSVQPLAVDGDFREIDIDISGRFAAVTVKSLTGYSVRLVSLEEEDVRSIAKGCSASLSPAGDRISALDGDHRMLHLHDTGSGVHVDTVSAPSGTTFDNHFWSNHPDWLASTLEGENHDILIHHIPSGASYQVTSNGDSDRADLFLD
jgi:uncharacterized membrane protein YbhN (UPF0104 family)